MGPPHKFSKNQMTITKIFPGLGLTAIHKSLERTGSNAVNVYSFKVCIENIYYYIYI